MFQTISVNTGTGFITWDFDQWSPFSKFLLVCLMFVRRKRGVDAGGMKVMRVIVVFKLGYQAVYRWFRPHTVVTTHVGGQVIREETTRDILGYFVLFILLFVSGALALTAMGLDMISATTASLTALANVGPAMGQFGQSSRSQACLSWASFCSRSTCCSAGSRSSP